MHEVGEGAEGFLCVGAGVVAVDLVDVDPVGVQAPQRVLDLLASGARRPDDLGLALGVDVGGVDDVDPGVYGTVDDADRLVVVGVAPGAEHHRAEA
jgi:hypothetical protein